MKIGVSAIAILPAMWILSSNTYYLVLANIMTGFAWATFDLGCMIAVFNTVSDDERTSFLSYLNFGNALAMFVGTSAGARVLTSFGETPQVYFWIFGLSTVFRIGSYFWLRKAEQTHDAGSVVATESAQGLAKKTAA